MAIAFGAFLFRTEIEKLKEENLKLQQQLDVYEIRKEQMHMQVIWRLFPPPPTLSRVILVGRVTLLLCFRQFVSQARYIGYPKGLAYPHMVGTRFVCMRPMRNERVGQAPE